MEGIYSLASRKIMIKPVIPHIQNILAVTWKGKARHTSIPDLTSFKLKTLVTMSSGLATDHQA